METAVFGGAAFITILAIVWFIAGIAALIKSILCVGHTPSWFRVIIGFVMALVTGPFYWVYYYIDKSYCRGSTSPVGFW